MLGGPPATPVPNRRSTAQLQPSLAPPTWGEMGMEGISCVLSRGGLTGRGTGWKERIRARWTFDTCWMTGDFGTEGRGS